MSAVCEVTDQPDIPPASLAVRSGRALDLANHVFFTGRLICFCLALGLAIGVTAAVFSPTMYTAESLLLIRTERDLPAQQAMLGPLPGTPAEVAKRILQSDIQIIESEPVIRAAVLAVQDIPPERTPGLKGLLNRRLFPEKQESLSKRVEAFRRKLRVTAVPDSDVIKVQFKSADRNLAISSAEAVVNAYRDRRASMYVSGSVGLQDQSLEQYRDDIRSIEQQIQQTRDTFGVLDPVQDVALAGARLDNIDQRISQARERLSAVNAELAAANAARARTPPRIFASREESNASPNDDTRNTLLRLRQEREHVAAQYTSEWPALKELDAKIAAAQAALTQNRSEISQTELTVRNPVLDTINGRIADLSIERRSVSQQLAELGRQRLDIQQRVDRLREAGDQLHDLQRTRDVMEGIFKQLSVGRAGAQLENQTIFDDNNTLRIVQPTTAPAKGRSLALTFILAGLLLGVVSAAVVSGLAILTRPFFILPEDAERAVRVPIIATFDARAATLSRGDGFFAVEQLATFIADAEVESGPVRVLNIVCPGGPLSGIGPAVGRALATDHRQRTLVIVLDPQVTIGAPGPSGVELLRVGGEPFPVVAAKVPNLWFSIEAESGPLRSSRISLERISEGISSLKSRFDRIILLSSQDLQDYFAKRLYALADANLVVVRSEVTRIQAAKDVVNTILEAGGDILGLVYTNRKAYVPEALSRWL